MFLFTTYRLAPITEQYQKHLTHDLTRLTHQKHIYLYIIYERPKWTCNAFFEETAEQIWKILVLVQKY